ncbi:MAG: helix-turn-helix domain-containing protein [Syntrophorhabdaceae bacterium]|nr:helix-turn-helix domain-containing protein [Syntrophorhabdaceae bacterium]
MLPRSVQTILEKTGGDKARASEILGINRTSLWRMIHRLKIAQSKLEISKCNYVFNNTTSKFLKPPFIAHRPFEVLVAYSLLPYKITRKVPRSWTFFLGCPLPLWTPGFTNKVKRRIL